MTKPLRFAVFGAGFWARYQLGAWRELAGAECVAIYNRTRAKAETLARELGIARVFDNAEQLIDEVKPDFIDIITDVDTHPTFTKLAAARGIPVICQKPMAPSLAQAEAMVAACREAGVPMFVHENFRWQTPIRNLKRLLDEGHIGKPHRAHINMVSGFPVFKNQPFLADLKQFVMTDVGSHVLDIARFLFGEAETVYCQTRRTLAFIQGENVATVLLKMGSNAAIVIVNMGYAQNPLERECFPETLIHIEGEFGALELYPDFRIHMTTRAGTLINRYPPPRYAWADPDYDVVHASGVPCNANILAALRGEGEAETTGEDNLKTVRLIFAAYDSAARDEVVKLR